MTDAQHAAAAAEAPVIGEITEMRYLTDLPFVLDARETEERFGVTASPVDGLVAETLTAL